MRFPKWWLRLEQFFIDIIEFVIGCGALVLLLLFGLVLSIIRRSERND